MSGEAGAPSLDDVLGWLQATAPLELAAEWDNVGVLLRPKEIRRVARALLTIDLTEAVVAEAKAFRADLVVAYHPPVFRPLARLDVRDPTARRVLAALAAGFVVWSPHTALDAAPGGIADWLAGTVRKGGSDTVEPCGDGAFGRVVTLARPLAWRTLLARLKPCFSVRHLQVARPARAKETVRTIAFAAGAGSSVLRGVDADALVTGEMSHHDVHAAVAAGRSVVLAGHSNTERGYLPVLRQRLADAFGAALEVRVSAADRDPLTVA